MIPQYVARGQTPRPYEVKLTKLLQADYYLQVNTGTGYPSCGIEYNNALANGRFQSAGGTSYHAYIKAPTIDTGCDLTFSSKATDAPAGHGECGAITALLTSSAGGQCVPVVLSETFGVSAHCSHPLHLWTLMPVGDVLLRKRRLPEVDWKYPIEGHCR